MFKVVLLSGVPDADAELLDREAGAFRLIQVVARPSDGRLVAYLNYIES